MEWLWQNFRILSPKASPAFQIGKVGMDFQTNGLSVPASFFKEKIRTFFENSGSCNLNIFNNETLQNIATVYLKDMILADLSEQEMTKLETNEEETPVSWNEWKWKYPNWSGWGRLDNRDKLIELVNKFLNNEWDNRANRRTPDQIPVTLLVNGIFCRGNWAYLSLGDLSKFATGWGFTGNISRETTPVEIVTLQNNLLREIILPESLVPQTEDHYDLKIYLGLLQTDWDISSQVGKIQQSHFGAQIDK